MKKVITLLGLICGLALTASAQKLDVKFEPVNHPQPEALQVWQDTGMRTGFATPFVGVLVNNRELVWINGWTLTDPNAFGDSLYVGLGLSRPLYQDENVKVSLSAGWATAVSHLSLANLAGTRRGDGFAVGFQVLYRFKGL